MSASTGEDWPEARVNVFRALWAMGDSVKVIGEKLGGLSASAVAGKRRRLDLPGRPSPIRRMTGTPPAETAVVQTPSLVVAKPPVLAGAPVAAAHETAVAACTAEVTAGAPIASASMPEPAEAFAPDPGRIRSQRPAKAACCWPIGAPGASGFRHCCAPTAPRQPGKRPHPYCTAHAAIAFVTRQGPSNPATRKHPATSVLAGQFR